MTRYKFAILKNETDDDHLDWLNACKNHEDMIDVDIINLISEDWLDSVTKEKYDFFLARSPGRIAYYKQLYDERIYIINQVLKLPVYPKIDELLIYENKRFLSYYLKARKIPHPRTHIFYNKDEAARFINQCGFPIVAKTNIGASGSGVEILKNKNAASRYIDDAFSPKGITRTFLPNFRKGDYVKRFKNRVANISGSVQYFKEKRKAATVDPQKWFVLFQEYVKIDYEWRCVVVDDSYFGHKKLRSIGEKISGTCNVSWDTPDTELLNLIKEIVERNRFWSQSIDLFYDDKRGYLVNEMQCFWGSKNPHQMINDGKPGRFVFQNGNWAFEPGEFNRNNSYDLRLRHILRLLESR